MLLEYLQLLKTIVAYIQYNRYIVPNSQLTSNVFKTFGVVAVSKMQLSNSEKSILVFPLFTFSSNNVSPNALKSNSNLLSSASV